MKRSSLRELDSVFESTPYETVVEGIETRMHDALTRLSESFRDEELKDTRPDCIRQVGLYAVALDELTTEEAVIHPFATPRWIELARRSINEFVLEDPSSEVLQRTAFFWKGYERQQDLTHFIYPAIKEPQTRNYTGKQFGAAVLAGVVSIDKTRSSVS